MKTISLQTSYDTKLNNATYDALKAFQLNTINSSTSDLANSKLRDIEASANTFYNSIASNFNMAGYNRDILKEYVPALVYTMYDGYYIYSKYTNTLQNEDYKDDSTYKNGQTLSGIKPYVYYSCRYKKGNIDVVITYTLDNYITVYGTINGESVNKSGYLIDNCIKNENDGTATYRGITIRPEDKLTEVSVDYDANGNPVTNSNLSSVQTSEKKYVKVNGVKYYNSNNEWYSILNNERYKQGSFKDTNNAAVKYYSEAAQFKTWMEQKGLTELMTSDAVYENGEKYEVIKISGQDKKVTLSDKEEWRKP